MLQYLLNMNKELIRKATIIIQTLQNNNHIAYFAGGCVRDMLLKEVPKDIDIATSATPETVLKLFPHCHQIGAAFGIINVVIENESFEVATFREEDGYTDGRHPAKINYTTSPKLDAARRDFTINAMFYDPINDKILDYHNGEEDLNNHLLKAVGKADKRLSEDFLRILRAIRFAIRFDLTINNDVKNAIIKNLKGLKKLSAERIRDELNKIFIGKNPHKAFAILEELGIFKIIIPELSALKGVEQSAKYHPEGDVFTHTMLMLEHMTYPNIELAWSILLHDIGKPTTYALDEDGIPHFYAHEKFGQEIAERILFQLKFSKKEIKNISSAVRNHMKFAHVDKMKKAKLKRFMAEDNFSLQLELHRIDCISSHSIMNNYIFLLDELITLKNTPSLPPPLLNGKDIINLGISPGPFIGSLLKKVQDAQLEGIINSKNEAIEMVQSEVSNLNIKK